MRYIIDEFRNITHLLNELENRPTNSIFADYDLSSQQIDNDNNPWSGTHTYEEAEELIKFGYDGILDQLKGGLTVPIKAESNVRRPKNDVIGFLPNVPNAIQGLPQSMINIKAVPQKTKVVNIIYAPVSNGGTNPRKFIDAGIKMVNVIHALELNGIRTNLKIAMKFSYSEDEMVAALVTVKHDSEHLNLKKICFPIAHPAMLRRFGFKWLETSPKIQSHSWLFGYGSSNVSDDDRRAIEKKLGNNSTVFTFKGISQLNEDEIMRAILNQKKS